MIRFAGIDPGRTTGVVVLDVPDDLTVAGARWVAGETFAPSQAAGLTEVDRDRKLFRALAEALSAYGVHEVAIECAAEAKMAYRGQRRQRTETAYRSGVYYAIALLASVTAMCPVHAYPAVTTRARGPGWMGRPDSRAIVPRRVIVPRLVALLTAVGAPPETRERAADGELRQHHLADALGVLAHHIADQALLRRATA